MLGSRQKTWMVVDIGGRWIKCVRYVIRRGHVREAGSQVIDIQTEGLLSAEEVGAAIGRTLRSGGEYPLAVVLPQGSAISQVMDLPEPSATERSHAFEKEIAEVIGLSAERCVYDRNPLQPFGGYARPQWITMAKEENLGRHISPLLGQGLRVEAVTTGGNALVAAFRQTHPEVGDACLVDIGATQTTVVRLQRGEPVQMTSLVGGGENWTEALAGPSRESFEEIEARLFRENLFADPVLGPALRAAVEAWRDRLTRQIDEWREEFGMAVEEGTGGGKNYLCGGYAAVRGLRAALTQSGSGEVAWTLPEASEDGPTPVWAPAYGAALMAAGISGFKASILPRSLAKLRERRLILARVKSSVLYLFILLTVVLTGAILKQQDRLDTLAAANQQAEATLSEIEASAALLELRDQLAARIEPIVSGQLNSLASLQTFRSIQRVHRDFNFTVLRFADRRTYFRGMDEAPGLAESAEETGGDPARGTSSGPQAFVVELTVRGSQAERLQVLSDIVGRLREDTYFANVDRLVSESEYAGAANSLPGVDQAYALLLTLAGEPSPVTGGDEKGAAR